MLHTQSIGLAKFKETEYYTQENFRDFHRKLRVSLDEIMKFLKEGFQRDAKLSQNLYETHFHPSGLGVICKGSTHAFIKEFREKYIKAGFKAPYLPVYDDDCLTTFRDQANLTRNDSFEARHKDDPDPQDQLSKVTKDLMKRSKSKSPKKTRKPRGDPMRESLTQDSVLMDQSEQIISINKKPRKPRVKSAQFRKRAQEESQY